MVRINGCHAGVFVLSACGDTASEAEIVDRNFQGVNAIDGTGLNESPGFDGDREYAFAATMDLDMELRETPDAADSNAGTDIIPPPATPEDLVVSNEVLPDDNDDEYESPRQIARRQRREAGARSAKVARALMELGAQSFERLELDDDLREATQRARSTWWSVTSARPSGRRPPPCRTRPTR